MQNLLTCPLSLLAQVDYSYSSQGQAPSPAVLIAELLIALLVIVAMWKVFTKAGRPGWATIIPIYNTVLLVQDSRPARLVGDFDAYPIGEYHRRNYTLHRHGKKFRQRRRVRNWYRFTGNHFPSDPRLRQRPVPRTVGSIRVGGFSATAARLDRLKGRRF